MTGGTITKLARAAAEEYVRQQAYLLMPAHLPPDLLRQHACYVTIYENPGRHFRAAFGHPLSKYSTLAEEVIRHTIDAIRHNTAHPLRPIDLPYLVYSVTVLSALERISRPEHLDPETYGLYLRSDRQKTAIILPGRTGIETPQDQIATAYREADIDSRAEVATLYRFNVKAYEG
ncbi:MAG: AMMECR1 domain-containing protein [Candidatus Andersenbacteria bacterium]|nr:AMMECR1 domain-containing protein [Candidatus Andersenbacteria bacterium]